VPYRWDLENIANVRTSCTKEGDIIRNSMKCSFQVTDANKQPVADMN
jgi:hypothetical protein